MAERVRAGELSSEALVTAHLARIAEVNPHLNAIVRLRGDAALADAREADSARARGERRGPLHGVPITVKDSFDTAGLVSTAGTLGRKDHVPEADATVVSRLKAAGAIVLGKTNTPELTLAYEANNLIYGMTWNPHDLSRGTGGSSGGAAAIVAAWGSALDVGTDTAGSIRYPAHCCGVAGLKPTSGRVPRTGHVIGPAGLQQWLTSVGPIARRVEDLELAFTIMAGPDDVDPHIAPVPLAPSSGVRLEGLRAALFLDTPLARTAPAVRAAVERAAGWLAAEGAAIDEALLPEFERPFEFFPQLFGADGAEGLEHYLRWLGTTEYSPQLLGALHLNRPYRMSTTALGDLMIAIDTWRTRALAFMQRYDLVIGPVAADVAPPPVRNWTDSSVAWTPGVFSYLVPFNFTGQPAVVVPVGSVDGLPIGVQCVARVWREDVALRAAAALEHAADRARQPAAGT
jgi:amidase